MEKLAQDWIATTYSEFIGKGEWPPNSPDVNPLIILCLGRRQIKSAKSREIPRKFELVAVQGHRRSSTLVPVESASTSY